MGNSKTDKNIIKSLNPLKFFSIVKERSQRFKNAPEIPLVEEYSINALAKKLHPSVQNVKVADIQELADGCKRFTLIPDYQNGTSELAYFSSGQYVTVFLNIDGLKLTRAYSISSSPDQSLLKNKENPGFYQITVKPAKDGLVSAYILENWKVGLPVEISAPEGTFSYVYLRDAPTVIGIAGGSGITPFMSMIREVLESGEEREIFLLYGNRTEKFSSYHAELTSFAENYPNFHYQLVISNDESYKGKKGFIDAKCIQDFVKKTDDATFYMCGPQVMSDFCTKALEELHVKPRNIRREMFGTRRDIQNEPLWPENLTGKESFKISVGGKTFDGISGESLLTSLERAGIRVNVCCRSGECSLCRVKLESGKVFVPRGALLRHADGKFGYIHSCKAYPITDIELSF